MSCSGVSPCCVVGCCALCGVCQGFCLCVVLRCWLLLRVVPFLRSCRPVGFFAVWFAVWFLSALPCAVLCSVSLGAVLRRAAARCAAWCCVVVCCVVLLRSFGAVACCAVPTGIACRPGALCLAPLRFAVFPRAVCSVLCLFCRGVLVRAVVRRCVLGCRAVRSLSPLLCAVLCFAVLMRLRCALRVVRAVAGAWCCGALLCVVLFPLVFCGVVLGLVARGCLLVARLSVAVSVWPSCLLFCGWCGLLWCLASLSRVVWCCPVALCHAVVLCCRCAVLFVLDLPSCGLSCGAVLCCFVLLVVCDDFCPVVASV